MHKLVLIKGNNGLGSVLGPGKEKEVTYHSRDYLLRRRQERL